MAISLSVPYTIIADAGIREGNPEQGPFAEVKFKCLWDDHYVLVGDLIGRSVRAGNQIIREFPYAYPFSQNIYCLSVPSIEPFGKYRLLNNGWLCKKQAIVTAIFSRPTYDFDRNGQQGQAWTTITMGVSGEFVTIPETTYRFADGTPTNTPIGKVIRQTEITVKRHFMPYLPVAEMEAVAGTVNSAPFTLGNQTYAPGYLLFIGGSNEWQADTLGSLTTSVDYKFVAKSIPWNWYPHPNRTTGFAVVTDGSGNPPYTSGDFTTLP